MALRRSALLAAAAALVTALPAAAFKQPDGTTIPTGSGLSGLFTMRGEAINAINDANVVPETFTPSCALTFEVLQRNAGYKNSFGWYNVTGSKPLDSQLHEFLTCNDAVGTKKVLDIKTDPAYAGGQIAFYQATGNCATIQNHLNIFYSQKQYNPDGANYYHLLIYNSTVVPKAFYFGWEDLISGGDNDFDDLTTFVTGIACTGGGKPCDTGKKGICAAGVMQCQKGVLTCIQSTQPSAEKCDGVDNDCNGMPDDGNLCQASFVCVKGSCVPNCGKDNCPVGTVCDTSGVCLDPACVGKTCPSGEKCVKGACVAPCTGVVCPHGQTCVAGACIDPCVGLTCDADQICVAGACVEKCNCFGCPAASTCQSNGACLPNACANVSCKPGTFCDPTSGACVDSCTGVKCPDNGVCTAGVCGPPTGMGGAGGTGGAAGTGGAGGSSGIGGGAGKGGAGIGGGAGSAGTGGAAGKAGTGGAPTGGTAGAATGGSSGKGGTAGATGGAGGSAGGSTGGKAGSSGTGGASGTAGKGGASAGKGGAAGTGGAPLALDDSGDSGGCGCSVPGERPKALGLLVSALTVLFAFRRRRSRKQLLTGPRLPEFQRMVARSSTIALTCPSHVGCRS